MAYIYREEHIPKKIPYNRRPVINLNATSITIHNTSNPSSTAQNERDWLTNTSNTRTASFHIVLDEKEAIEVIPLNEVAWHAGDGSELGSGNRSSIGIEICESGNYDITRLNAIDLVAKMLNDRGWQVDRLRRHYDWSGKNCPRLFNTDGKWSGWSKFVDEVKKRLNELQTSTGKDTNNENRGEDYMISVEDANKIIRFLSAGYSATDSAEARKEFNRLANELRKASGQSPYNG